MTMLASQNAPSSMMQAPRVVRPAPVIAMLLAAIERSPLIDRVSTDKLRAQAEERFDRFCDGKSFDLRPIVVAIIRAGLGRPEECLFVVGFAKAALATLGLEVKEPELEVSPKTRARIVKEAEAAFVAWQSKSKPARMQLGQILLENRLLAPAQLKAALARQRSVGGRLGTHLVKLGFLPPAALAHYLGLQLNQPAADLGQLKK